MERYRAAITHARETLVEAILQHEAGLEDGVGVVDARVRDLLREVGHGVLLDVFEQVSQRVVAAAEAGGLKVERRPQVQVMTLFGRVRVESPYLWVPGRSARPVQDRMGLWNGMRTPAVERALTDFGSEESFGQSAKRFEEHYGFAVDRTTVLRVVESHARRAESFLEKRFDAARGEFAKPLAERPGVDRMMVQLDGCEIRTGTLVESGSEEKTVRGVPKRRRKEEWREVRVGLARPLDEVDATCVARMDAYAPVTEQLFSAACVRGLSSRTEVIAVADGGQGLREEVQAQFVGSRFIYDRPHLKQHLYEAAEAMGLKEAARESWVADQIGRIDGGRVEAVLDRLREHKGRGKKRVGALIAHLTRFEDAVDYDAFRAEGLPIGSGEVESAHRTIPQKRLKLPGAWWRPDNVNPMLALRVVRRNGWWNELWAERSALAA